MLACCFPKGLALPGFEALTSMNGFSSECRIYKAPGWRLGFGVKLGFELCRLDVLGFARMFWILAFLDSLEGRVWKSSKKQQWG